MRFKMFVVLTTSILTVFPAAAAEEYLGGDWHGWSYITSKTGEFEGCTIARENSAGERLTIILRTDAGVAFGRLKFSAMASGPSLRLIEDEIYPGKLLVDGNEFGVKKEFTAIATDAVGVHMPYENEIFEALGDGGALTVELPKVTISFQLNGSARALEWLRSCTGRGIAGVMWSRKQPGAPAVKGERFSGEAMEGILRDAGMTGYKMGSEGQAEESVDHEWRWGQVRGMQFNGERGNQEFSVAFGDLLNQFRGSCSQWSNIETWTAVFYNEMAYGRSSYDCLSDPGIIRYAFIVVDNDPWTMVFLQSGAVEFADDIEEADRRVFKVLQRIYK